MPTSKEPGAASSPPLPGPRGHRDYAFFYRGLEERRLLVQRCDACGTVRTPPSPMCPHCQSLQWTALECTGEGKVHSYTVHHHPPLPGFDSPHVLVLVDMTEGFRLLGTFKPSEGGTVAIGIPVQTHFVMRGDVPSFEFHLA